MIGTRPTFRVGPDLRDRLIRFLVYRADVRIESSVPVAFAGECSLLVRDLTTDALSMLAGRWIRAFWAARRRAATAAAAASKKTMAPTAIAESERR